MPAAINWRTSYFQRLSLNCLRKALDAAPKGQNADALKALIQRSEKLLESQKAKKADGKTRPQVNSAGKDDSFTAPAGWPSG